jgi:acetyl esterase/lipase
MDINRIHPELRKAAASFPRLPLHWRWFLPVIRWLMSMMPKQAAVEGVSISSQTLGNISIRIYRPEGVLSAAGLLWIHGGGMIMGKAEMDDRACSLYASKLQLVVVSVDYRLAPEHIYPIALDDCVAAWHWFQQSAEQLGVDPARIAIAGQSAGGGLAASLAQRLYDEGGIQPAAQALFCPMLDDRTAARIELDAINHRIWNNRNNRAGWSYYLGHATGLPAVGQYAVPARRQNLSGLPPTWIGVGDIDLFHAEDSDYAERLQADGVSCQFDVVPMAPHAFETFVPAASVSVQFMADHYRFLQQALALEGLTGSTSDDKQANHTVDAN